MESQDEQNKSEKATPFKLSKAREKGSVARGTDLGFFTALTAFLGVVWISGPSLRAQLAQAAQQAIVAAPRVVAGQHEILAVTGAVLSFGARSLIWISVIVFAVVLLFELVQTGPVFTTEQLRLDFGRLNPARGFKRIFSFRILIETAKNLLKLVVYVAIAAYVIRDAKTAGATSVTDAVRLSDAMAAAAFRLLMFFAIAALFFAALDQVIARREFGKKMRMTRRDVRRELRDREGDPRMKQRRKQLHRQYVKLSQSVRNIKGADVLITNPTHFAVALRYDTRSMAAPTIVSQGANQYALRLKRLAFVYGVVIVQEPALARALYHRGEFNKQIPEQYFRPVAEIYLGIRERHLRKERERAVSV